MRYAIYFSWNDGTHDSFFADNAKERDANISGMLSSNNFKMVAWCRVYASGEYGKRVFVKGTFLD